MSFTFKSLFMETITSPRDAAQKIIDIGVSRQTSILSIVFTVCITVILFFLDLSSSENSIVLPLLMHHPLMLASVMILGTLWSAFVIGFFGKNFQYFIVAGFWLLIFLTFVYSGFKGRSK